MQSFNIYDADEKSVFDANGKLAVLHPTRIYLRIWIGGKGCRAPTTVRNIP